MNIIVKKLMSLALKDISALNDLELPEFKEKLAEMQAEKNRTSAPPARIMKTMKVTKVNMGGHIFYRAADREHRSSKKVMFIHGGGFVAEAFGIQWEFCARLARRTGCEIIFPEYPLVPKSSSRATHEMLFKVYRKLFSETSPENITIIGDSAGGTLALSLSMLARDRGLPLAKELVLISPGFAVVDLTEEEQKRLEEVKKRDLLIGQFPIMKVAILWCGDLDKDDYRTNVLKGSVEGLPRITLFSGTDDILNIPARKFAARLESEGHPYHYEERIGGIHDYALSKEYSDEFELIVSRIV